MIVGFDTWHPASAGCHALVTRRSGVSGSQPGSHRRPSLLAAQDHPRSYRSPAWQPHITRLAATDHQAGSHRRPSLLAAQDYPRSHRSPAWQPQITRLAATHNPASHSRIKKTLHRSQHLVLDHSWSHKMHQCVILCLVVVFGVPFLPHCNAQDWESLAVAIAEKLVDLWQHGEFQLLNHQCNYSVTPKIRSWELYFQGTMWCPGWTPIKGEALTRSRSGVVGQTTRDFVRKVFNAGLITEQEGKDWLAQ